MRRAVTRKSSLAGPPGLGHPPFRHPGFATRQSTILPRLPRSVSDPLGLVFELPAHSTEWSGRQGGPVGRPPGRPWPPFGPARAALRAALRPATFFEGRPEAAGRPSGRPSGPQGGPPLRTRDVKPVAVGSTAMAASKAVQLDSAALEFGGAWFAKQEVDVAGVERVDANSTQVAHASLLPRVRG
eukprot:scaffold26511_cov64-Phaeocystis_antarctica.AAC.4